MLGASPQRGAGNGTPRALRTSLSGPRAKTGTHRPPQAGARDTARFNLGTIHRLPTVSKFEALPALRLSGSLARRCRAKTSRVFDALVEKERSLISTRTRQALAASLRNRA